MLTDNMRILLDINLTCLIYIPLVYRQVFDKLYI